MMLLDLAFSYDVLPYLFCSYLHTNHHHHINAFTLFSHTRIDGTSLIRAGYVHFRQRTSELLDKIATTPPRLYASILRAKGHKFFFGV